MRTGLAVVGCQVDSASATAQPTRVLVTMSICPTVSRPFGAVVDPPGDERFALPRRPFDPGVFSVPGCGRVGGLALGDRRAGCGPPRGPNATRGRRPQRATSN